MDRLFTICYLPVCLLLLGVVIKFNTMPARPRILTSFALFTLLMLGLPLVSGFAAVAAAVLLGYSKHAAMQQACSHANYMKHHLCCSLTTAECLFVLMSPPRPLRWIHSW